MLRCTIIWGKTNFKGFLCSAALAAMRPEIQMENQRIGRI